MRALSAMLSCQVTSYQKAMSNCLFIQSTALVLAMLFPGNQSMAKREFRF